MRDTLRKLAVPVSVAGAIIYMLIHLGPPENTEDLAIYLSIAAMGLVAWLIQNMAQRLADVLGGDRGDLLQTQERITSVLDNHLAAISNHMASSNEILRNLNDRIATESEQATESRMTIVAVATSLTEIRERLLSRALRPKADARKKKR